MKNKLFRALSLGLLLSLLAGIVPGYAAAKPKAEIQDQLLWAGGPQYAVIMLNWPENAKVVSVTSSKKSVIKVGKKKGVGPNDMYMQGLKAGKAKITVKYKVGGKTYSTSRTLTVKKYPNPFEWIKVNGKKVNLTKNKFTFSSVKYTKKSFTVSFKLKSGWRLEGCNGAQWVGDTWSSMTWENKATVKLPAK